MPRQYSRRPFQERFWEKIDRSAGPIACWPWQAATNKEGYGLFETVKHDMWRAHRLAYVLTNGPIPAEIQVCHTCDNPPCCNPVHLFPGTSGRNMADRDAKGRQASGERHGSQRHPDAIKRGEQLPTAKLTEDDVRAIRQEVANGKSQHQTARDHHVSVGTVNGIIRGWRWAHVQP